MKTDGGRTTGKIVVNVMNKDQSTFFVYGYMLKPNTVYYLYYTTASGTHLVGSAMANMVGLLYAYGAWTNPMADLQTNPKFVISTTAPPKSVTLTLAVDKPNPYIDTEVTFTATLTGRDAAGNSVPLSGQTVTLQMKDSMTPPSTGTYAMTDNGDGT